VGVSCNIQLSFPELYSNEACSPNCVAISDEDEAEYWSFESMIETSKGFFKVKSIDLHISWNMDGFQEGSMSTT
jgi:hypothetical protein